MSAPLPPFLATLLRDGRAPGSQIPAYGRTMLEPLFAGGVLDRDVRGRGENVVLRDAPRLRAWIEKHYPSAFATWEGPAEGERSRAVALRRDSKRGGKGVARSGLLLRSLKPDAGQIDVDGIALPVGELTQRFGVAACLIRPDSRLIFRGTVALVENFEAFLHAERILPATSLVLFSAGRISDRLIAALARAEWNSPPLWHLPDYDPIGLADFLRLHTALGEGVRLFTPPNLDDQFRRFGNDSLLKTKSRNRELLVRLASTNWPGLEAQAVFELIKETGYCLEQESLLLNPL